MSTAPLTFTGVSTFSNDFQTILQREQAIAQLPIKALQNKQTDDMNRKQALVAINPVVASLGSAVASLASIASNQGLVASSSDTSTVSVVNTGATSPANYSISNIRTLATAASETSLSGYADSTTVPVSTAGQNKVDLVVGSNTYHLDLTGKNNLTGLRDAINNAGAGVTASILTTGTGNYLSIASNTLGATTLTLNDIPAPASLISNTGTGTETSNTGYPDTNTTAVSTTGKVDFKLGSTTYHLDITASNNLTGLMNAINGSGASVTASITNVAGSNFLQITETGGGTDTMSLSNVQKSLITNANQGTNADFMLNGNIHITQATNVINNVIPGMAFTLNKTNNGTVNIAVSSDRSQLASALQTLVQNYNALEDQVTQQVGASAGPLGGNMLISTISNDMRQLSSYWAGSNTSIRSLADMGVTFDTTGHMSFDQNAFNSLSTSQITEAFKFFGSSKSGFGALASNFTQLSDPTLGLIRLEENGIDADNQHLTDQIATLNTRASQVTAAITAQLQQADALVAELQSQQTSLNASIQSINYVTYGKVTNANGQQ